jgi:hypothetical protein
MPGPITDISKTSLWGAWKEVRTEVKNSTVRDVIDFLDYDIDPDIWIARLLRQVKAGTYELQTPLRFALAKSGGFKRRLTFPAVPDIVLFRAIANYVPKRAQVRSAPTSDQHRGRFFMDTEWHSPGLYLSACVTVFFTRCTRRMLRKTYA